MSKLKIYINLVLGQECSPVKLIEEIVAVNPGLKDFSQISFQGTGVQNGKSLNTQQKQL
jgi:hypothetical protein